MVLAWFFKVTQTELPVQDLIEPGNKGHLGSLRNPQKVTLMFVLSVVWIVLRPSCHVNRAPNS